MKFFVDGTALDDVSKRWFIDSGTVLPASAQREVAQLRLARRDGVVHKRLSWGLGSVTVSVVVPPVAGFGTVPTSPVGTRVRAVQAILARAQVIRVEDDLVRTVEVVDVQVSEPARLGSGAWRVEAQFETQPFWRGSAVVTSPNTLVSEPGPVTFTGWADTTGDLVDGVVRVRGPFSRREIRAKDGSGVIIPASVTASQYVFIDVRSFTAWRGAASAWEPTATAIALDYPPAGPLRLYPTGPGVELHVDGDGFNADSSVSLRAHRFYL